MIELARHLEVLLLSNDCVAVPGFGGFVAHYVPAHIDEADGMFLPPMRTIGFNPQLKMNDSLLAQSYVEAYDISYPEAIRRIEQEAEEIRRHIMHEGSFSLDGIGVLASNDEGNYRFTPCESGLLTPSFYGLGSYEFNLLNPSSDTTAQKTVEQKEQEKEKNEELAEEIIQPALLDIVETTEENAVSIKMSWIRNAVAIAAAIVLFFLLTTPVANSNLDSPSMSALRNDVLHKLMPKDSNVTPAAPVATIKEAETVVVKESLADSVKLATSPQKKQEEVVDPLQSDKPYCLVLASQVKRSNAEEFVRMMRNRGFKDTDIYINNNVVRVVYGHFKSESAAYVELYNLRFEENFEEAWVYKRKTGV